MYKYLKTRVLNGPNGMIYPCGIDVWKKLNFKYAGYIEENDILYVLGVADENQDILPGIMASEQVTELTKEEAIAFSEKNERKIERVTDEGKIRRLEIKSRLGQTLTADELKALDPNDPTPGLEYNKILADKFRTLE